MKTFFWIIVAIAVIGLGFFLFNSYIYNEKQAETMLLSDGQHLGFVRALTDNGTAMDFDDAVWLSGKEGEDAAIEAGLCTEETRNECLPNNFFIKNEIRQDKRVPIGLNVEVIMQTWKMEVTGEVAPQEISPDQFAVLINDASLHWRSLPYTITIEDGAVVGIEEVYVP